MKIFSLYDSQLFLGEHPKEDAMAYDIKNQFFAVADGVALWENIEYKNKYPNPSGSGKIAETFCESAVDYKKQHPKADLEEISKNANKKSGIINKGRSKYNVFTNRKALFGATSCLAEINNKVLSWAKICDCGISVWDKNGKIKFQKNDYLNNSSWPHDLNEYDSNDVVFVWRNFLRNAVDKNGKLIGYGLVTGEKEAENYLETGKVELQKGDVATIYSDGFAPLIDLKEFRKLVNQNNDHELEIEIKKLIEFKNKNLKKVYLDNTIDKLKTDLEKIKKLENILGDKFQETVQWSKEKSIIVIKI